jgi:hypothetical protein
MFMSDHQTTGQNHYIKVPNKSFENVADFKYLRAMITNQNNIQKEMKSRLNSGNACYHAVNTFCHLSLSLTHTTENTLYSYVDYFKYN